MKTIDSVIDFFDRLATPRMTDTQIEIIENKLLNLAIDGDKEAARRYTDLSLSRMSWERTRSPEYRHDFNSLSAGCAGLARKQFAFHFTCRL